MRWCLQQCTTTRSLGARWSCILLPLVIVVLTVHGEGDDWSSLVQAQVGGRSLIQAKVGSRTTVAHDRLADAAAHGPYVVKLSRKDIRLPPSVAHNTTPKSLYVGHISIGTPPRTFRVSFDTASGQVFLPSVRCRSPACVARRRFEKSASSTAVDINADGSPVYTDSRPALAESLIRRDAITIGLSSLDLGDGKVTGDLLQELVCLGNGTVLDACTNLGMVLATEMLEDDAPLLRALPQDGTVGLGLRGASISPLFNFLTRFSDAGKVSSQFGLFLGADGGEISFGGYKPERLGSPLAWSNSIRPEEGYWQVQIRAVRVGNHTLDNCTGPGGCGGIIDSCASSLGVPQNLMPSLRSALSIMGEDENADSGGCSGPELHLDLEGGSTITLRPEDYATSSGCIPHLVPVELPGARFAGTFVLGQPVLRRYYTVFDAAASRVGFSIAAGLDEKPAMSSEEEAEDTAFANTIGLAAAAATPELMMKEARQRLLEVDEPRPSDLSQRDSVLVFLLQALAMQGLIMLFIGFFGAHAKSSGAWAFKLLIRIGLLSEPPGVFTRVPPSDVPEGDECVICLGSLGDDKADTGAHSKLGALQPNWCRLRCGHHFHEECIEQWLSKVPKCPVCRGEVVENSMGHVVSSHEAGES